MNTFRIFKLSGKIKLAGLKFLPNGPLRVGETCEAIRAFFFHPAFLNCVLHSNFGLEFDISNNDSFPVPLPSLPSL